VYRQFCGPFNSLPRINQNLESLIVFPYQEIHGLGPTKDVLANLLLSSFRMQAWKYPIPRRTVIANLVLAGFIPIWSRMQRSVRALGPEEFLERSIIVCAHPDDEILWFSSIICIVDRIVVCYLGLKSSLQCTEGRKRSISQYPMKNISCLGIDQSEVFKLADWQNPVITEFGLRIPESSDAAQNYRDNYIRILKQLRGKLHGFRNVFTHNPWGEYGHEEHVQVYTAVKELQREMGFNLWFSNYCSNVSFALMMQSLPSCHWMYLTRKPNKIMSRYIEKLYMVNECWTWFNPWRCFSEEAFIKGRMPGEKNCEIAGHMFPLNMIKR
jgi:LmbE family N-acetylglucosaminyl deacetylase